MTSVTFQGRTYSDDGSAPRDMRGGGHRLYLLPMLGDAMLDLSSGVTGAADAQGAAELARDQAQTAAAQTTVDKNATAADRTAVAADKTSVTSLRDQAQAAAAQTTVDKNATAADRSAVATDRAAVTALRDQAQTAAAQTTVDKNATAADRSAVATDKAAVTMLRDAAQTAATSAAASATATAADRTAVAADKASTQTALSQAQTLVGTAGTGTATGLAYAALTKSLVATTDAVAVHIYDTRQDSDGGAWAARPCGSWYWEALGTATRGATRRFPAVALIVARASSLTIYDAHDLDATGSPRMWMVFTLAGTSWTAANVLSEAPSAVFALEGRIWVTAAGGTYGLLEIDFANDRALRRTGSAGYGGRYRGTLTGRNAGAGYAQDLTAAQAIVAAASTAVHARVLPGAPLDSAGLHIPTVAVTTAAGASIIHPWGTVYDITYAGGYRAIHLGADGRVELSAADAPRIDYGSIPYADAAHTAWRMGSMGPASAPALLAPTTTSRMVLSGSRVAGCADGLTLRAPDAADPGRGMSAFVAASYATGWMPGDIRGAWLCGTAAGSITGSGELIGNGDFASNLAGWVDVSSGSGTFTRNAGGYAELSSDGGGNRGYMEVGIPTVVGQTYIVSATISGSAANFHFQISSVGGVAARSVIAAPGAFGYQFAAEATTTYIGFQGGGVAGTTGVDNVSVKLGTPDRSGKGLGLCVLGILVRTALSCGLAAWSGFSGTNYLEQSYSAALDFGTGDFSLMCWVMLPAGQSGGVVFSRADDSNPSILLAVTSSLLFRARLDGANEFNVSSASDIRGTGWRRITAVRRGTAQELWLDDVLLASAAVTPVNLTDPAARVRWGERVDTSQPFSGGSICMARVAAYAPRPAQIRQMYEDERALIIGGTPATLGGTVSNVTTLAANETSAALAVGTGDGVSVFAGLGRVQYLDGVSGGVAIGSDAIVSVAASGPHLLVATTANAGLISDAVIARDRLAPAGPPRAQLTQDRQMVEARGVTVDATPTDLSPRIYIGEREAVTLDVTVQARTYGASSPQGGMYRRQARYIRDAGGNVALAGAVQTIGADQETTAGMDVTLQIDTSAQTVTPRVTGVAGTRIVWTARITITRISEDLTYAAQ